jgi:Phage integrase central domain/Arm DNA-binding domain
MLTDTAIRNAKLREKPYKLTDGGGLYLIVNPNGARYWRFRYRIDKKEKLISLGIYPEVSLRAARDRRDEAKKIRRSGVDPSKHRQAEKIALGETFEAIAREWFAKFSTNWAKNHSDKVIRRIELDLLPWIGARNIREITAQAILACLRRIEQRGALDTAHRALQNCGQVFRYAVATGRAPRDPSADLRGALPPAKAGHFASITEPAKVAALLRAIDSYDGRRRNPC